MPNTKETKFLELAKYYEQLKDKQDEVRTELEALMLEIGYGTFVQDPDLLTVYKVVKPNGTFMYYRDIQYNRTAIGEERAGTLSKKDAEAAGFILKK